MKELENASARFHISRLEAIELSIRNEFEKAYKIQDDKIRQNVLETYDDRYYRTCYEVQSKFGIGFDVSGVDTDKVKKLISKPWASDNKTFSDRVWTKKNEMIDTLRSQLIRTCATGGNIQDAVNSMMSFVSKDVKNARYAATRLLQTETAFFSSVSEKKALKNLDVEQYEILATLDSKTSPICQEMDGQVFKLSEYEIGATAPPFHVNCRSTTCPHFDDEYGERVGRDRAGNTYMVPGDMTFNEWKKMISKDFDYNVDELKYYKPVVRDKKDTKTIIKNDITVITCERLVNTKNNLYIDNNLEIKRRELDFIDMSLYKAIQLMGIEKLKGLPNFVIIPDNIDNSSLASFNPIENTIFLKISMGNRKKLIRLQESCSCPNNSLSSYIHELNHWKDAYEYIKNNGKITMTNYKYYDAFVNKKAKKKLDKLEKKGYNIHNISSYSNKSMDYGKYDEVYAEYVVKKILER